MGDSPTPKTPKPRLAYGMEELAEAIGVSRAFVYQERAAGRLKTFKLGRRTMVRAEEAKRYLDSMQEAA